MRIYIRRIYVWVLGRQSSSQFTSARDELTGLSVQFRVGFRVLGVKGLGFSLGLRVWGSRG